MDGSNILGDEGDLLGAFFNGDLRGIASVEILPVNPAFGQWSGKSVFLLYAFGNTQDTGESYTLRYFDASESSDFELSETLLFSPDAVYGSVFNPVVISSSLL